MKEPTSDLSKNWNSLGCNAKQGYRVNQQVVDMSRPPAEPRKATLAAQPQTVVFDIHKAAVVIIDMQNDFCATNGWLAGLGADVGPLRRPIAPISRVAAAARHCEMPVVWLNWGIRPDRRNLSPATLHAFNHDAAGVGLGDLRTAVADANLPEYRVLTKDGWGAQVVDELTPHESDIRVDKHRISGFIDTPLDSILRNAGVATLFFAGVNADECVLGTLMDANFRGYDTLMLEDCVATSSPAFCLDAAVYNVRFCFGFTTDSQSFVTAVS